MGREIRRVPPDWEHPINDKGEFMPLCDRSYDADCAEWYAKAAEFRERDGAKFFHEWDGNPPDKQYYRPEWTVDDTFHYQVYETVSEGTPVTPHFSTKEELVLYLAEHGTFWDSRPWPIENARAFMEHAWMPSMIISKQGVIADCSIGECAAMLDS